MSEKTMYYPSVEDAKVIAESGDYKRIPVCREVLADFTTPILAVAALRSVSEHCFLLESAADSAGWGRYSFIGFDPTLEITCKDGQLCIRDNNCDEEVVQAAPSDVIRSIISENKCPRIEGLPPLTGGLVGYFAYDYIKYSEPSLVLNATDREQFQDLDVMLFDKLVVFDNYRQVMYLIANAYANNLDESYPDAVASIEQMYDILKNSSRDLPMPGRLLSEFTPMFNKQEYCSMVKRAIEYIYEGDIFQVVLSNRLEAKFEGSLFDTYRVLRTMNPSPYLFYFTSETMEMAGSSPETLVKLEDGTLYTFPLAGTRPRGASVEEDIILEIELLADEKELAEHNMLVDLGRNDLGKISEFGSVEVVDYKSVLKYSHVMHIGSTVTGKIRPDKDALDALDAVLPAGTLSGAPKIRAMEIINELENDKRGVYGGAVGYLDFTGNMDVCIAIRLAYHKGDKVFVRSGAGIVAQSNPESEFQECINKAGAVMDAISRAERGQL